MIGNDFHFIAIQANYHNIPIIMSTRGHLWSHVMWKLRHSENSTLLVSGSMTMQVIGEKRPVHCNVINNRLGIEKGFRDKKTIRSAINQVLSWLIHSVISLNKLLLLCSRLVLSKSFGPSSTSRARNFYFRMLGHCHGVTVDCSRQST